MKTKNTFLALILLAQPALGQENLTPWQQYIYYESGGYVAPAAKAPASAPAEPEPYATANAGDIFEDGYYATDPNQRYNAEATEDEFNHGVRGLNF